MSETGNSYQQIERPGTARLIELGMTEDFSVPYLGREVRPEECAFQNAATCPDCAGEMFRQGGCFFCPRCGYESCGFGSSGM